MQEQLVSPCRINDFNLPSSLDEQVQYLRGLHEAPLSLVKAMINHSISGALHQLCPRDVQPHGNRHSLMVHISRFIEAQTEVLRLVNNASSKVKKLLLNSKKGNIHISPKFSNRFRLIVTSLETFHLLFQQN